MTIRLYRAAGRNTVSSGCCLAADESDASAYLDNPGYGGATLYTLTAEVDTDAVLSLVDGRRAGVPHGRKASDAWHTLADALGVEASALRRGERIERIIDDPARRAALRAAGYEWVVYEDTYPDQCVTWVYLGSETLTMEEA